VDLICRRELDETNRNPWICECPKCNGLRKQLQPAKNEENRDESTAEAGKGEAETVRKDV
jgi:hypothetical protein